MYRNFPKGITLLSSLFCHRPREMFALWNSERTFHWASKIISQGQALWNSEGTFHRAGIPLEDIRNSKQKQMGRIKNGYVP